MVVKDLTIQDSTCEGLYISGSHRVLGAVFDGVTINGATTFGIQVKSGGSATLSSVKVTNAAQGGLGNTGGMALALGAGNSGFRARGGRGRRAPAVQVPPRGVRVRNSTPCVRADFRSKCDSDDCPSSATQCVHFRAGTSCNR